MRHIIFNSSNVDKLALSIAINELRAGEFLLMDMRLYGSNDFLIQMVEPLNLESLDSALIGDPDDSENYYNEDLRWELAELFLCGDDGLNEFLINDELFSFRTMEIEDRNTRGIIIGLVNILERFGKDELKKRIQLLPDEEWASIVENLSYELIDGGVL